MPFYNKLVRDYIPAIIEKDGKVCRTRVLSDEQYIKEVNRKLHEELAEYEEAAASSDAVEELADLLELLLAAARHHGADAAQLEAVRSEKALKRGAFADKIFLIDVEE